MDWLSHIGLFLSIRDVISMTSTCQHFYECRDQCLLAYQRFRIPKRFWHLKPLQACKQFFTYQRYHRLPLYKLVNMPLNRYQVRFLIYMYQHKCPKRVKMLKRYRAKRLRNRVMWRVELWCK